MVSAHRVAGAVVRGDAAAAPLRLVHGDVGPAQQLGHIGGARVGDHHTDRHLDGHPYARHLGGGGEPLGDLPSLAHRIRQRGDSVVDHRDLGQQQGELVAAEPAEQVTGADQGGQPVRGQPQQLVPSGVPEGAVDLFELFDVEQQQRHRVVMGELSERLVDLGEHGGPVEQPSELIVHRLV